MRHSWLCHSPCDSGINIISTPLPNSNIHGHETHHVIVASTIFTPLLNFNMHGHLTHHVIVASTIFTPFPKSNLHGHVPYHAVLSPIMLQWHQQKFNPCSNFQYEPIMNECKMQTVHKKLCQKLLLNVRNNSLGNMHKVQMSETRAEPSANQQMLSETQNINMLRWCLYH